MYSALRSRAGLNYVTSGGVEKVGNAFAKIIYAAIKANIAREEFIVCNTFPATLIAPRFLHG